ncbi:MAG: hypothetical protein QXI71_03325 [Candidatus Bathyarchaeia archaeon]
MEVGSEIKMRHYAIVIDSGREEGNLKAARNLHTDAQPNLKSRHT